MVGKLGRGRDASKKRCARKEKELCERDQTCESEDGSETRREEAIRVDRKKEVRNR